MASDISEQRDSHSSGDKRAAKTLPIINPLVRLPQWPSEYFGITLFRFLLNSIIAEIIFPLLLHIDVSEAGMVSKVLLANADALCAAAVPLMDPDEILKYASDEEKEEV